MIPAVKALVYRWHNSVCKEKNNPVKRDNLFYSASIYTQYKCHVYERDWVYEMILFTNII